MNDVRAGNYGMQSLYPSFAPSFLDDHARRIINDPKIALVELVANCWDAGADCVEIRWPEESRPEMIEIKDNGTGMTREEFTERWPQLNYNRRARQGEDVQFPSGNQTSHRKAFGRNGKGRHSMFCFSDVYRVNTWNNGEGNVFEVRRTSSIARMPYEIQRVDNYLTEGHGTIVSVELGRNYLSIAQVRDLLGSKFITDPSFKVLINGKLLELANLEHLIDRQEIVVADIGAVFVSQVDTQQSSRTSHPHGVAWWVNKRLVGEPSWKDFTQSGYLDRRTMEAKRYTFLVEADILEEDVEEDWGGFLDTRKYRIVRSMVEGYIRRRLKALMRDIHRAQKTTALEEHRADLVDLPVESRYYIGLMVDGIQDRLPTVQQRVLSATVGVLSNLEKARSGYVLLDQLARLEPDELDALSDILDRWSVHEARIVLSELERRLRLIERLEQLVENPTTDELHELQPLFRQGLWIFGPEYESIQFTSNQALTTVIRDLLKDGVVMPLSNPRKRPDFVALSDRSIGVYSSDAFDERAEVDGYDRILIVELKRGGSRITQDELRQGHNYAIELRKTGKVQKFTEIIVFVLGTEKTAEVDDDFKQGNTTVCARAYTVILRKAHARTFHLLQKIKDAKQEQLDDPDIEQLLAVPPQGALFAREPREAYEVLG